MHFYAFRFFYIFGEEQNLYQKLKYFRKAPRFFSKTSVKNQSLIIWARQIENSLMGINGTQMRIYEKNLTRLTTNQVIPKACIMHKHRL